MSKYAKKKCELCIKQHPFCSLFNVGLLGYVKIDRIRKIEEVQSFLLPGHSLHTAKAALPESDIYFLHPSINDWLKYKTGRSISDCKSFVVGDSKPITQEQINNAINEIKQHKTNMQSPKLNDSHTTDDTNSIEKLEQEREQIDSILEAAKRRQVKSYIKQFSDNMLQKREELSTHRKALDMAIHESQKKATTLNRHSDFRKKIDPVYKSVDELEQNLNTLINNFSQKIRACTEADSCESLKSEFNASYDKLMHRGFENIVLDFENINSEFNVDNTIIQMKENMFKTVSNNTSLLNTLAFDLLNKASEEINEYEIAIGDSDVSKNSPRMTDLKSRRDMIQSIKDDINRIFNEYTKVILNENTNEILRNLVTEIADKYKKLETDLYKIKADMGIF